VSAACVEQTFYACEWLNDTAKLRQFSKPVSSVLEFAPSVNRGYALIECAWSSGAGLTRRGGVSHLHPLTGFGCNCQALM
jgi:hypothetical protein